MTTSIKSWIAATFAGVVVCAGVTGLALQSSTVDVTGVWAFTVESAAGTGTPTVTFKQQGEKLTGHYSSMLLGEADLTGAIKGAAIGLTVQADVEGMKIELRFEGTVEGKDSIKGKLSAGEFGDGTFTAKRK